VSLDPGNLLLSLLIGSVGFVAFSYGKKQGRPPQMAVGLTLMIFPYFVPNLVAMIAIALVLIGVLWAAVRFGW
jgi:hypothetical protein